MLKQVVLSNNNILEFDMDISREEFDKGFLHLTEGERNEAWDKTHPKDEPIPVPTSNKGSKLKTD